MTLLVSLLVGCVPMLVAARRRSAEAVTIWALIVLTLLGILLARVGTVAGPSWVSRYLGVMVAPMLLLAALGSARARVVGVVAIALTIAFCANPGSFAPGPQIQHAGDRAGSSARCCTAAMPSPSPSPSRRRWRTTTCRRGCAGRRRSDRSPKPSVMNWSDAYSRLQSGRAVGDDRRRRC